MNAIKNWLSLMTALRRRQLVQLLFIAALSSFFELLTVTGSMFLITAALQPGRILQVQNIFFLQTLRTDIFFIGSSFCVLLLLALRFFLSRFYVYQSTEYAFSLQQELSLKAFNHYLALEYPVHTKIHSADAIYLIFTAPSMHAQLGVALLVAVAEFILLMLMIFVLLYQAPLVILSLVLCAAIALFFSGKFFAGLLKKAGIEASAALVQGQKLFTQAFGNFKLITIHKSYTYFEERFESSSRAFARSQKLYNVYQQLPRITLETTIYAALVITILMITCVGGGIERHLSFLSFLALSMIRITPAINRFMALRNQISFSSDPIVRLQGFLQTKKQQQFIVSAPVFNKHIDFKDITFGYELEKKVVNSFYFSLHKGDRCALIGQSGSGKTTIIDLLLGLYQPERGAILFDGQKVTSQQLQAFAQHVGYVPQTTYLFDGSIRENILFGRAMNPVLFDQACRMAHVYDFAQTAQQIDGFVGEGGVLLSGGQRQRIALARALYNQPQVIIFDEATSALDPQTEKKIVEEIIQLPADVTLIFVTHKYYLLHYFNQTLDLNTWAPNEFSEKAV